MNYLLKRQPSPAIVEPLLTNSKHSNTKYCFCRNCFRSSPVCRNSVPRCSSSTYVSALKLQEHKKRHSNKSENASKGTDIIYSSKKLREMFKIMSPKTFNKKILFYKRGTTDRSALGKYSNGCTKSYDPNLLHYNPDLERLDQPVDRKALKSLGRVPQTCPSSIKNPIGAKIIYDCLKTYKNSPFRNHEREDSPSEYWPEELIEEFSPHLTVGRDEFESLELLKQAIEDQKQSPESKDFTVNVPLAYSKLQYLHSVLDICLTNDMVSEGYEFFQLYKDKILTPEVVRKKYKIVAELCNLLLYALSCKGYWYLMTSIVDWMVGSGIKLTLESFSAQLHCLVKVKTSGNEEFVKKEMAKVLNSIFQRNFSLNDIFCKTSLTRDASEGILKIVREAIPSFEIKPNKMELSSDCLLLKSLHAGSSNLQPQVTGLGEKDLERLVEEQLRLERGLYLDVKAISSGLRGPDPVIEREKVKRLKAEWREALTKAIEGMQKVEITKTRKIMEFYNLNIYLSSLPVSTIVDILMEKMQRLLEYSGNYSPNCDRFHMLLGHKVFQCYQLRKKDLTGYTEKTEKLFKKYVAWCLNPKGPAMNSRQKWQMLIQDTEKFTQLDAHVVKWPEEIIKKIGRILLNTLIREIKFDVKTDSKSMSLPVLYTILRYREGHFYEEIKCHPLLTTLFDKVGFDVLRFNSDEIPMLCPPKPWKSPEHGGYLFMPTEFVRRPGATTGKMIRFNDVPPRQLYATFDSLNALQSVPWKINEEVLDIALEVFKSGGSPELNVPKFPEKPPPRDKFDCEVDYKERRKLMRERAKTAKDMSNNYALWCEALYRLSLADHYRGRIFWMPQNCDFRGRVYPVPPLINHLGSDLFRSLMVFAKGKPLGPKGLDWLKIHLINLTGTHKRKSINDRLKFANEIIPVILDSAEKPLTGEKWWMKSDEPWQTLAACMEMKKVLSSPDPEAYVCNFPVHQDGSCNGLQHYAALGKDLAGAESVNLVPCDLPQDVYSVVAALVEEERAMDASKGIRIAKILKGFVERKVVKQTVMTTVYGVTNFGAKLQIIKRLEEFPNFPEKHLQEASAYLAQKTFLCLGKMFTSAKQIQEWFLNCADEICGRKDYVQWTSPLGLPVVQSYAKVKRNASRYDYGSFVPDTFKQKNAFPPNFIHSLDSCHMMLTSLHCEQAGLTFAAVHDCYWTHPCNVDAMNKICREQFVLLHSEPILENLARFFKKVFPDNGSELAMKTFDAVPKKGSFDIKEVINSVYFFS